MEMFLIFDNIRIAKKSPCVCVGSAGGHAAVGWGGQWVPPHRPSRAGTRLCPGSRCCLRPGLCSAPIAV